MYMEIKRVLFGLVVAVGALAVATDVHAFWGSRGSCGSCGGSWGSSGGSWGCSGGSWGSSGGSWGSCGSCGGLFHRRWGSYGSCGSCGGSYGSCGSCGGSYGSQGSAGGTSYIIGSYGQVYAASTPTDSKVQTAESTTTRLTLHVPEDAKVTLAGVPTKQNGETRQFSTTRLAPGQTWDGYKVVVEVERDGKTLSQERILTLRAGEAQELSVDFNQQQIAKL
jgi:uncharacterized protein (TIGR03000 family)